MDWNNKNQCKLDYRFFLFESIKNGDLSEN